MFVQDTRANIRREASRARLTRNVRLNMGTKVSHRLRICRKGRCSAIRLAVNMIYDDDDACFVEGEETQRCFGRRSKRLVRLG